MHYLPFTIIAHLHKYRLENFSQSSKNHRYNFLENAASEFGYDFTRSDLENHPLQAVVKSPAAPNATNIWRNTVRLFRRIWKSRATRLEIPSSSSF